LNSKLHGFNPDYYDEEMHGHIAFGFKHSAYTEQHISKNSLYISISGMLWMFDIGLNRPNRTDDLVDDRAFTNEFLWWPLPF